MDHTVDTISDKTRDRGGLAVVSLIWVAAAFVGGLFVVDAIGALETDADDCSAYSYSSGPGGYGCDPTASDAEITVSATDGLADRQLVTVTGVRYDAWTQVGLVQCAGEEFLDPAVQRGVDDCDLSTVRIVYTNGSGGFSTSTRLSRVINTNNGGEVDCALPDAYCLLAAGAVGADLMSTTEADFTFISFDPELPPVPAPTIDVEVLEISATNAVVSIECSALNFLSVDINLQQEQRGRYGSAYGYFYPENNDFSCDDGPLEYEIELMPSNRRIGRGDVMYYVSAYGDDGFESVFASVEGEFRQRRTPRIEYRTENVPGETVEILDAEIVGRGEDSRVRVRVACEHVVSYGSLSINLSQWAGLDRIDAYGEVQLEGCPGEIEVEVPIRPYNGRLQTGTAQLDVRVYARGSTELGGGFYSDRASSAEEVRLRGRISAPLAQQEPNPDSRITIDRVTRDGVSGTISCDEPVMVDVQGRSRQYQGRLIREQYAYDENDFGQVECDGEIAFDLEWNERLSRGDVNVTIYANGYAFTDTSPFPTTTTAPTANGAPVPVASTGFSTTSERGVGIADGAQPPTAGLPIQDGAVADGGYYNYIWGDSQSVTVRVRN